MRGLHRIAACGGVAILLAAGPAVAETITDFAVFGSTQCTLGNGVTIRDSADPANLPSLLVGGGANVSVRLGASVGGVRAGNELVLGKAVGSGASAVAVAGDVVAGGALTIAQVVNVAGDVDGGTSISIGQNSVVEGNVVAAGEVDTEPSAVVLGDVTEFGSPRTVDHIALPAPAEITPGSTDIATGAGETTDLSPGAFGTIDLGNDNILRLRSGRYDFAELRLSQQSTLELSFDVIAGDVQPIEIFVAGDVDLGNDLEILVDGSSDESVHKNLSGALYLETHGRFHLRQNGTWIGTTVAPFDAITFGLGTRVLGAAWGLQVHVKQGAEVDFTLGQRFEGGFDLPRIDFAAYAGRNLTVGTDVHVSFRAPIGGNGTVKVKRGGQTGSVRAGERLNTGVDAQIRGNQIGNRRVFVRNGSLVEGSIDGGDLRGRIQLGPATRVEGRITAGGAILWRPDSEVVCEPGSTDLDGFQEECLSPNSDEAAFHVLVDLEEQLAGGNWEAIRDVLAAAPQRQPLSGGRGSVASLTAGTHGPTTLGADSALTIGAGVHYLDSLRLGDDCRLIFDLGSEESATVFVLGRFVLGRRCTVEFTGEERPEAVAVEAGGRVKLGRGTRFRGTLVAQQSHLVLGQSVDLLGAAYAARNLHIKDGARIEFALADRFYD